MQRMAVISLGGAWRLVLVLAPLQSVLAQSDLETRANLALNLTHSEVSRVYVQGEPGLPLVALMELHGQPVTLQQTSGGQMNPNADLHYVELAMHEPLVDAWNHIQERCASDRTRAADHIDRFLREHLDDLHDLARRAEDGCGPSLLLDRIERAVAAVV